MPKVSIIIPAYNEEVFIGKLLETILKVDLQPIRFEREIIVVDNGSKDRTFEIASSFEGVRCLRIEKNQGKGGGTKYGIANATGDYVLIQDADLEYDPNDYIPMLEAIVRSTGQISVYGSRILGERTQKRSLLLSGKHPEKSMATYIANTLLSVWACILYGRYITDTLTGYKIYPMDVLRKFTIRTYGFETDHELTAKLLRSGVRIIEVPISYHPRSIEEGKKIRATDFFIAMWTLLKYRFVFKKNF